MHILIALLIIFNIWLLSVGRISTIIKIVTIQGLLIGLVPIVKSEHQMIVFGLVIIFLKSVVFPKLLFNISKKMESKIEAKPYVSLTLSSFLGILFLFISYKISPNHAASIFTIFIGLFYTMTRKKAINQIIGFLIFENGIFLLGFTLAAKFPIVLEIAILLDVVVGVLVMKLSTDIINKEFTHTDIDKLNSLKG